LSQLLVASQSKAAFGKAVLLGGATALGCGIAYAVFVAVTDYQLALLTIGIAFLVARVIRKASAGVGGRKYQLLAMGLTYAASTMGYAPGVFKAIGASESGETRSKSGSDVVKAGAAQPVVERKPAREEPPSLGGLALALAGVFAITLAAPILAASEAPMGLLIVGFGLWEAWRLTRGIPLALDGPYRTAPMATGPPTT
jgi:hypothetical protein